VHYRVNIEFVIARQHVADCASGGRCNAGYQPF